MTATNDVPRAIRLPVWLVSSPHRRTPPDPDGRTPRPYGVHHARRVGQGFTACGLFAAGWPFFWDLPFGDEPHACCDVCTLVIGCD